MMNAAEDDFIQVTHLFGLPTQKLPSYQVAPPVGTLPTKKEEKLNVKLLLEIMDFIKAHPTTWSQEDWFRVVDRKTGNTKYVSEFSKVEEINSCGTSFCFAGHVALHEGFPAPPINTNDSWTRIVDDPEIEYPEHVEDFARDRLGLTYRQANALFAENNSMEDLERMVSALVLMPEISGEDLEDIRYDLSGESDADFLAWLVRKVSR